MSNEFFAFPAGLPETLTGAGEVARLSSSQAANLSAGIADAESAGKGLAATLAMLVFGSVSYKTNPWSEFKTARGKALAAAFGGFPRVTVKPGKGIALADFQAFFDAAVAGAMAARNAQQNPYLVPKADRKPKASKAPAAGGTVTGAPAVAPVVAPLSMKALNEAIQSLNPCMDNTDALARVRVMELKESRARFLEAERQEAERAETERLAALESMKREAIARLARRDEDIRLRAIAFAELATSLGIKLTPAQLKALDALEGIKQAA